MGRLITRDEQEQMDIIRRNHGDGYFVSPEPKNEVIRIPQGAIQLPESKNPVATVQAQIKTNRVDDARAFAIKAMWISGVTAVFGGTIAWVGGAGVNLTILIIASAFFVTFLITHWQHLQMTPEAIAKYNSKRNWDEISKANAAMIELFRKTNGLE